jgi:sugar phosphate isomerase/epimerase
MSILISVFDQGRHPDLLNPRSTMSTTRRNFLHTAVAAGTGAALGASAAGAIGPIQRAGTSRMRLSLAAYSYRQYLNLPKQTMTLPQFIDACALMPLDAVELTSYYFPQTGNNFLAQLKGRCTRLGLDVSGCATNNNFCTADAGQRKTAIAHVKQWIEHTARLGGKTLRIFAGNTPKGEKEADARARCVAAIHDVCDHAAQYGVYVALENHGGITATIDQMLAVVQAVKHDWFGVNFDTGNFHSKDPYADLTRLAPYAVVVQIKTEIQRAGQKPEQADLKRLIGILQQANFRGYVALEHEAKEDPKTAVPQHLTTLRKLLPA